MSEKTVLVGNPNVGKTAIFTRLTGTDAEASNYPGTTVDVLEGDIKAFSNTRLVDVPGTYSLEDGNDAEIIASEMVDGADGIINVIDSTNLERNLGLTFELLKKGLPMMVVLNMWVRLGGGIFPYLLKNFLISLACLW